MPPNCNFLLLSSHPLRIPLYRCQEVVGSLRRPPPSRWIVLYSMSILGQGEASFYGCVAPPSMLCCVSEFLLPVLRWYLRSQGSIGSVPFLQRALRFDSFTLIPSNDTSRRCFPHYTTCSVFKSVNTDGFHVTLLGFPWVRGVRHRPPSCLKSTIFSLTLVSFFGDYSVAGYELYM